jgi:NAD(P)-dependent dehydrogenase (short-subunit alcohol dehydrogenase family)
MRILVTGAARAIGATTVRVLSERGHEVVATARDPAALGAVEAVQRLRLDVLDADSVAEAVHRAGPLDAIVNNAAIAVGGPLEDYPIDQFRATFETNTVGALRLIQAVVPAWRQRGSGVIVNVSSIQGRVATPLEGAYAASKYALEAISETLHYELGHFGIRVAIVEPGYTAPGMKPSEPHRGPDAYAQLWAQWSGADTKVTGVGGRTAPEVVATAIADAIENPDTPLRVPVGEDTSLVFATRSQLDDAAFEVAMRAVLEMSW